MCVQQAEGEGADSEEDSDSDLDEEAALKFYRGVEEGLKRKRQTTASSTAEG